MHEGEECVGREPSELNWPKIRNTIRRRLSGVRDIDDATQEACGLCFVMIERGVDVALAIWRSTKDVRRGRTLPRLHVESKFDDWEERADARYLQLAGVSESTRRAARTGSY